MKIHSGPCYTASLEETGEMKSSALCFLVPLFAMQTAVFCAQDDEKPKPQLALSISEWHQGGFPSAYHPLRVESTNTSNEDFPVHGCATERGLYKLSVLYNGIPLVEKDKAGRLRSESEARGSYCSQNIKMSVPPGESFEDIIWVSEIYDMSKPGTYEITVSRDTFPDNPKQNVKVKSNTLTIVVAEPGTVKQTNPP